MTPYTRENPSAFNPVFQFENDNLDLKWRKVNRDVLAHKKYGNFKTSEVCTLNDIKAGSSFGR